MTSEAEPIPESCYQRVSSEMICSAIESYGPAALISVPARLSAREVFVHQGNMILERSGPKTVGACEMAVARIRELEEKVSKLVQWQEGFLEFVIESRPISNPRPKNFTAWPFLCRDAIKRYGDVLESLAQAVDERRHRPGGREVCVNGERFEMIVADEHEGVTIGRVASVREGRGAAAADGTITIEKVGTFPMSVAKSYIDLHPVQRHAIRELRRRKLHARKPRLRGRFGR